MLTTLPPLLGQIELGGGLFWVLVGVALFVMFLLSTMIFIAKQYKRCPSNRVLVIYGRTNKGSAAKTIHGGAALVIPLIQDYAYLSLEPVQIDIPLRGALSSENIRVNVPSCFTVAIGTSAGVMDNAAVRLLGLTVGEIRKQAEELIFGQLRQVIASMRIEEINRDRDKLLEHIQSSLEPELNKIGLILINVNITDITDESGYIDAIGQKAASLAIQNARGDVAENLKMGEIRVAEADRAKLVSVALAQKEQIIGTREAERDQSIRVAEMQKEQTIGERTAEFEREAQVNNAERDKRVRIAEADATAIEGENISNAKIAASQAELAVKRAEAYQLGETRKKEAEASVLEAQNRAMAKAALAEAERVEAEKRALLEAPAKAEKAKMEVDAAAEAAKRRILAQAEADAIYAKLEAEARGEYEKLAKKGEGLKQIVTACGSSKEAFQLMLLEHLDSLAESSAKAISNIKFDKVVVWEGGNKDGRSNTADWLSGMAKTLPPMMQVMKDIGGVELPEAFIRYAEEGPDALAKSMQSNGVATSKSEETPAAEDDRPEETEET